MLHAESGRRGVNPGVEFLAKLQGFSLFVIVSERGVLVVV